MGYGAGQINKSQQPMGQRLGGMPAQGMGQNLVQPLGAPVPTPYNTTPDLSQQGMGQALSQAMGQPLGGMPGQGMGQALSQAMGQPLGGAPDLSRDTYNRMMALSLFSGQPPTYEQWVQQSQAPKPMPGQQGGMAVQRVAQTTPTGNGYMPAVQPPAGGPERAAFFDNLAQQGGMPAQGMGQPQTQSAAMAELQRILQGARTTMQPGALMGQPIGQPMSQEDLRNLEAKLRAMPMSPYNTTPDLSQQRQRPQRQRPDFFNAPFSMQGLGSLMRRSRGRR